MPNIYSKLDGAKEPTINNFYTIDNWKLFKVRIDRSIYTKTVILNQMFIII